jgi:hypothetical protein
VSWTFVGLRNGVSLALVIVVVADMFIELAPPTKASSLANASTFLSFL